MIFRRISYRIALQFMGFVFLLLLVNGAVFLIADLENARRDTSARLHREEGIVREALLHSPREFALRLPAPLRDRVRLLDMDGHPLVTGVFFENVPFAPREGVARYFVNNDQYLIYTAPFEVNGAPYGYFQIAEMHRLQAQELPMRALLLLLISAAVSALTFIVGLFFARTSLKPAEQMFERLEQFTQDASHELRTPLAALNSSLDLAVKTQKYREGIASAKDDVKHLSAIVERLLELARLDAFTLSDEQVDLSELVETCVERHVPLADKKGITLKANIDAGVSVRGDPALIRQVVTNLIANAIKFGKSSDGTVTVRLTQKALEVKDNGIGIAKDALPRIFERFFQADDSRSNEGSGLGLALVKRIVELHGWTVDVRSAPGKGATFTVRFA